MPRSRILRYSLLLIIAIFAAGGIYTSKETTRAAAEYPATGSFITMDGIQVHYQLSGSGQPVAHSTLMVLPTTGHMVPKTRPEAIVQAVRQIRVR